VEEVTVYEIVGEQGFTRLTEAFYRQVPKDDILGPMYPPDDFAGAEKRLRDFLIFRFGGPQGYIEERGHPRLRLRHALFPINQAARDRWLALMNAALDETNLHPEATRILKSFFEQIATFLINTPE
jgi:hemoglobin